MNLCAEHQKEEKERGTKEIYECRKPEKKQKRRPLFLSVFACVMVEKSFISIHVVLISRSYSFRLKRFRLQRKESLFCILLPLFDNFKTSPFLGKKKKAFGNELRLETVSRKDG